MCVCVCLCVNMYIYIYGFDWVCVYIYTIYTQTPKMDLMAAWDMQFLRWKKNVLDTKGKAGALSLI